MIRTKSSGVRLNFASEPIRRLVRTLGEIADHYDEPGIAKPWTGDLVITSGNDSTHSHASRHYRDEAIDVRTHNFRSREAKRTFRAAWEMALGGQFRVLLEGEGTPNEHFHAQVRRGHTYWPSGF